MKFQLFCLNSNTNPEASGRSAGQAVCKFFLKKSKIKNLKSKIKKIQMPLLIGIWILILEFYIKFNLIENLR